MFPAAVLIIPLPIMYRDLELLDTRTGLAIAYTGFSIPFVVWVMRDFFRGLPVEIEESALIDGCSRLGVLLRIALPLAAPGLVAVRPDHDRSLERVPVRAGADVQRGDHDPSLPADPDAGDPRDRVVESGRDLAGERHPGGGRRVVA
jgi:hypothetical protein